MKADILINKSFIITNLLYLFIFTVSCAQQKLKDYHTSTEAVSIEIKDGKITSVTRIDGLLQVPVICMSLPD